MYGADEKKAFEDMLAEIGEDSDEEESSYVKKSAAKPSAKIVAESKNYQQQHSYNAGAKAAPPSSGSNSFQCKQTYQMTKQDEEIARFGVESVQSEAQMQSEQISITKRWLTRSCSSGDKNTMKCFVERERSSFGMQTTYRCYLEGTGEGDTAPGRTNGARFLMSAKKRVVNKTSYYLISLDNDASDDRGSETVLGKVI